MLPAEVAQLLAGEPAEDAWEAAAQLLTTDADGYPRMCLLSRAELEADRDTVRCALRARRTIANLRRDGQGLLVVVGAQSAHYIRLRVRIIIEGSGDEGGGIGVAFGVEAAEEDTLGIPLRPLMFRATSFVREQERWAGIRLLLRRLAVTDSDDRRRY
jgi:hypothetical protein